MLFRILIAVMEIRLVSVVDSAVWAVLTAVVVTLATVVVSQMFRLVRDY